MLCYSSVKKIHRTFEDCSGPYLGKNEASMGPMEYNKIPDHKLSRTFYFIKI